MIIAVDFDGTCVEHKFPGVGADVPGAVSTLKSLVADGHKLILWTVRSGEYLQGAVEWFKKNDIPLYGIQGNPDQSNWSASPKAYARIYIDDAALGCPLLWPLEGRPFVDWREVKRLIKESEYA